MVLAAMLMRPGITGERLVKHADALVATCDAVTAALGGHNPWRASGRVA
jgi:hypothetical protein